MLTLGLCGCLRRAAGPAVLLVHRAFVHLCRDDLLLRLLETGRCPGGGTLGQVSRKVGGRSHPQAVRMQLIGY